MGLTFVREDPPAKKTPGEQLVAEMVAQCVAHPGEWFRIEDFVITGKVRALCTKAGLEVVSKSRTRSDPTSKGASWISMPLPQVPTGLADKGIIGDSDPDALTELPGPEFAINGCSTCPAMFDSLPKLRHHIILFHGRALPNAVEKTPLKRSDAQKRLDGRTA